MPRSNRKVTTLAELFKRLESEGWEIERRKAGHVRLTSPKGGVVFTSSSPSDFRALRNVERDLKRAGWKPEA
jgi:predicted RNA binding protein YcfA (HicA-like mRNA interferase family)